MTWTRTHLPSFHSSRVSKPHLSAPLSFVAKQILMRPLFFSSPATTMIRPSLTRSSSLCRSRRSLMSSPQSSLMSPDPDLLSMASSSLSYRPEADDEHIMFSSDRRGYVAVAGTPRNGFTVWTYRCFIQTSTSMHYTWGLSGDICF